MKINFLVTLLLSVSPALSLADVILSGPGDMHIFKNQLPSEVDTHEICIGERKFDPSRDRLAIYGNSSVVIADGWIAPLKIYNKENCQGEEMILDYDRYYRSELQGDKSLLPESSLGEFDNSVRSFILKKGFSCTMANNPDGTGYSRVFIADNEDLVVNSMPEGLCFVSFIRVCRHDWIGKKGISGGDNIPVQTRSSWFYTWGADAVSSMDCEFVPMRHNQWWDSWENIGSRVNTSAVLGFNEPDHADQSDLGVDVAIGMWPEMMKSGLRIGSPAPDSVNKRWLSDFLAQADSLNYRVDFVATHMYWNSQDPYKLADQIANLCKNTYGGRPMWITEWNNGANWTNEWWPDMEGPRRDAEFNIIYDEKGNTTNVTRPHTEANSAVHKEWLEKALDAFDKCDWLERHAFYNWVEDARSVVIEDKLTPAGKVFAEYDSRPAFNRATEYIHTWKIAPPLITKIRFSNNRVRIDFYDNNGETGKGYYIERRVNKGKWERIDFVSEADFRHGTYCYYRDFDYKEGFCEYRLVGLSYLDSESIKSRVVGINVTTNGVGNVSDNRERYIYHSKGNIIIEADAPGAENIYSVDGRFIKRVEYDEGTTSFSIGHGVYLMGGQKLIL